MVDGPIVDWRKRIEAAYPYAPQRAYICKAALLELDKAIAALAAHGFPLHVVEGPPAVALQEWPKMVFHIRCGERTVQSQYELDELGDDWYPSMDEARHAAGMTKQFQRGGIFDKALPAMPDLMPLPRADAAPHDGAAAALLKGEFLKRKGNGVLSDAAQEREVSEDDLS